LARINYQHGKRLREQAKKQKREEKAQKKLERQRAAAAGEVLPEEGTEPAEEEEPAPAAD